MSPILIRPVREQLEHDRLIRHLATKYKRKFEVSVNLGDEQVAPGQDWHPDALSRIWSWTDGKKLAGLVEVETGESVNNLEAMAQWVHFSRARVPFHLYVPVQGYDAARRLLRGQPGEGQRNLDLSGRRSTASIWSRPVADASAAPRAAGRARCQEAGQASGRCGEARRPLPNRR